MDKEHNRFNFAHGRGDRRAPCVPRRRSLGARWFLGLL